MINDVRLVNVKNKVRVLHDVDPKSQWKTEKIYKHTMNDYRNPSNHTQHTLDWVHLKCTQIKQRQFTAPKLSKFVVTDNMYL